jgi:hypothetical protein
MEYKPTVGYVGTGLRRTGSMKRHHNQVLSHKDGIYSLPELMSMHFVN